MKRMMVVIGIGADIRGGDYTKAAIRALRYALWHNSLGVAKAMRMTADSMVVEMLTGVPTPGRVDTAAVLPHGTGTLKVVEGGLDLPAEHGHDLAVTASAAVAVCFEGP